MKLSKKKKHKAIQEAIELLKKADQMLAAIPDTPDEVALSQLDIRSNVRYLQQENGIESWAFEKNQYGCPVNLRSQILRKAGNRILGGAW